MTGKAVVWWPSPVLARISRFRPMSPASQVGLEAYRFESCRERFFVCVCVCVCVDRVRPTKCRYFIRFVNKIKINIFCCNLRLDKLFISNKASG